MRAAGILVLVLAGLTAYWVVTGRGSGSASGTTAESISSPLNALGGLAGQGNQTLSSTGLTPPPQANLGSGFTPPPPTTPNLTQLLSSGGVPNSSASALDPTQQLLGG